MFAQVLVASFLKVKMSLPSLPLLLLLVCVTTTRGAATSYTPITCKAGDCTAGTRTSVTCYFNEDISVSRQAFSVDLYPFNASKDDIGRLVLACDWKESGTKPDCYVKEGFSFSYSVTDHLTLEILNATEEVAGQYSCSLVPLGHRTVTMCTLTVNDNSHGGYADLIRVNFGLNVVIVILVLFVVVGIVVAVVLIRKRQRQSTWGSPLTGKGSSRNQKRLRQTGKWQRPATSERSLHGEQAGDEKQEKPNGSIDGKQQTTQSPDVCGEMEPTTPMLTRRYKRQCLPGLCTIC